MREQNATLRRQPDQPLLGLGIVLERVEPAAEDDAIADLAPGQGDGLEPRKVDPGVPRVSPGRFARGKNQVVQLEAIPRLFSGVAVIEASMMTARPL